ncbi:MAG: thiamine phosphate synthase [Pseudomonadota bacterium]
MRSLDVLAATARRLNREAGSPPLPVLYFFTDPARTPDPVHVAERLPRGAAVVFRHFGAANRIEVAQRLVRVCRRRRLVLLVAADPDLARRVRADGVHWPERLLRRRASTHWIETAAAHSRAGLDRAARAGMDACVLAPLFPSRSASALSPLGPLKAGSLARHAGLPVVALGGVSARTAKRLVGRGFVGLAAVEALVSD